MFSLSLSLSLFLSIFFFLFAPTILCLIIHLYHAVDTYVRELFPSASVTRMCVCVTTTSVNSRKFVSLFSFVLFARIFLSFSVFFFFFFRLFSKQRSSVEKYKEHLLSTGMTMRKWQNSLVEKYSSRRFRHSPCDEVRVYPMLCYNTVSWICRFFFFLSFCFFNLLWERD